MPSGSYLSGIVSGFTARKDELEQRRWAEEQQNNQRESKIYEALIQSPDPEIQSMAFSGLLDSANPKRKKGLQGWMGEMQKNPAMEGIRKLIQTPVSQTQQVQSGPPAAQGYLPAPPSAAGSAALPTSSPTAGGAAPPTPMQPGAGMTAGAPSAVSPNAGLPPPTAPPALAAGATAPQAVVDKPFFYTDSTSVQGTPGPQDLGAVTSDPRLATAPPEMSSVTTSRPRQVLRTPGQTAQEQATGHAAGAVEGEIQGLVAAGVAPAEARATVLLKMRKAAGLGAAPFQAVAGETLDEVTGKWRPTYASFDRQKNAWTDPQGKPLTTFRRAPTGANPSRSDSGRISEAIAQRDYGMSMSNLAIENPDALIDVAEKAATFGQENARATTAARKGAENDAKLDVPVDLKTAQATGAPVGAKQKEFIGQQVPTQESMKTEMELKNARSQMEQIIPLLDVLPSQHELIGGLAPGMVLAKRRVTDRERVAALESAVQNIAAPMQHAKGDTRLSNADMDRAFDQMVQLKAGLSNPLGGDTRESALARIRQTMQFLDLAESNRIQRPTPGGAAAAPGTPPPGARGKAGAAGQPGAEWQMIDGKLYHNGQPF